MPDVKDLQQDLNSWSAAFPAVKRNIVYRWQAAYPNTFCIIWYHPTIGGQVPDWACLDVHYDGGGNFQALGGFWVRGYDGAFRPEQDWRVHPSPMRKQLYNRLRALMPAMAPDKTTMMTWATVMEKLTNVESAPPVVN